MARVKALTERTIAERFREIKDEESLWGEISLETRALAKRILEDSLEEELSVRLQAARYRRTEVRRGWRNGGYRRQLISRWVSGCREPDSDSQPLRCLDASSDASLRSTA
jgi:hypothetical protein